MFTECGVPQNLVATPVSSTEIKLNWSAVEGHGNTIEYRIRRRFTGGLVAWDLFENNSVNYKSTTALEFSFT